MIINLHKYAKMMFISRKKFVCSCLIGSPVQHAPVSMFRGTGDNVSDKRAIQLSSLPSKSMELMTSRRTSI